MTHDDDKFDEFLAREARRIDVPPAEVPRDAMWEAIAAARAARRGPATGGASVTPLPPRRPLRYTQWAGMAATLLLGLGIGRYAFRAGDGAPPAPPVVAAAGDTPVAAATPATPAPAPAAADPGPTATGEAVRFAPVMREARAAATRPATLVAAGATAPRREAAPDAYTVASQAHLTRAEALVAVVATMPQDAMMDSLTSRWAKDVLANTRLLLDSPAGDDPVRRRLLEDLETVLVQLVQRTGRDAEDRAMLDRTLQKTQILTRLRTGAAGT